MSVKSSDEYHQLSEDWRHRDVLTWQMPVRIATIAGGSLTLAFTTAETAILKDAYLLMGGTLVLVLSFTLLQNLWFQAGSTKSLSLILQGETDKIPKAKGRRAISPKELGISRTDFFKMMIVSLTGSTILLFLGVIMSAFLFGLAFY